MLTPEPAAPTWATPQRADMSVTPVRPGATSDVGIEARCHVSAGAGLPFGDDQRGR